MSLLGQSGPQRYDRHMNYRHAYHAGNFADVLKHTVLALVIDYLKRKPAPFRIIDTNAGSGLYTLDSIEAEQAVRGKHVLVLGAGGAAKGIVAGLVRRHASVVVANRRRPRAEELAKSLGAGVVDWEHRAQTR